MKVTRSWTLLFCVVLSTATFGALLLAAQTLAPSSSSIVHPVPEPHVDYEKYVLTNGLQVILVPDPRVPKVHVNLSYHVGSKNEPQDRTGFAHLFEHMMFEGSKDATGHYATLIEAAGGTTNAYTTQDQTDFFETVPTGSLEYALWLESDRLATLPEALSQERLDNQKAVVENERRERVENQPYGLSGILLDENLYPAGHPYGHSVLGSHDHVRAATLTEVKDFFSTYYAPNNLSLAIVGDFDVAVTKKWIEKYFAPIPPAPPIIRPARWIPHLDSQKVIEVQDHVAEERTYLAWVTPSYRSTENVRLELAARLLNRRLNASLVYAEKPLCSDVSTGVNAQEDASEFVVTVSARAGAPLAQIEQKVDAEIAALAKDGPSPDELQQTKRRVEYGELSQFDTLQSTAETLNRGNTLAGDPAYYAVSWKQLEAATPEDVSSAVRQYVDTKQRFLLRFHPDPAQAEKTAALDRSVAPQIHQDPPLRAPRTESGRLANGLEVFVAQRIGVPKVSVLLTTRAGTVRDPEGKNGLAMMTVATMPNGTSTRSSTQIRDGMESAGGTTIESSASREAAGLGYEVLSENVDQAFAIFADVVLHPAFKQYNFETNMRQFQDSLADARTDAGAIADQVAPSLVFGPDHPYARPLVSGLQNIQRDDLRKFYETYWKPDDAALVFAGNISLEEAISLAQKYLGSWSGTAPAMPEIPPPSDVGAGRIYLIDKPDAPQTLLTEILPSAGANSPDRFAVSLANNVWGAMWGSRLSGILREKQGYTYGFHTSMGIMSSYGAWTATGAVQTDKTKESVAELVKQLRLLREQPISDAEFTAAKKADLQQSASTFETSGGITSQMGLLWSWHLPMSALGGESEGVQQTGLAAVSAAVARYADPNKASLLVVGDRSRIESGLRELHLGPVVLLDLDGKPANEAVH